MLSPSESGHGGHGDPVRPGPSSEVPSEGVAQRRSDVLRTQGRRRMARGAGDVTIDHPSTIRNHQGGGDSRAECAQHSVYLPQRTVLDWMEEVCAVLPVQSFQSPQQQSTQVNTAQQSNTTMTHSDSPVDSRWHPPVDLSHLEVEGQAVVRQMLYEASDVFSRDDGDIGCIQSLKLKIHLKDDIPVQKL